MLKSHSMQVLKILPNKQILTTQIYILTHGISHTVMATAPLRKERVIVQPLTAPLMTSQKGTEIGPMPLEPPGQHK